MLRVVMPARLSSSRLPQKMLQKIGQRTVLEHSIIRALEAVDRENFWVAVDDPHVRALAEQYCHTVMTSANCRTGTDRCAEAAAILGFDDADVVANVQADMPFLNPKHLGGFLSSAEKRGTWDVLTAICDVRLVRARTDGFIRDAVAVHVGMYAYRRDALRRFASLPSSAAEQASNLEQMRAVENGFMLAYHAVPDMPFEVNTPQDLAAAQWMATCLQV